MTVAHCLDYISFTVFVCNGTSLIAEIASCCLGDRKVEFQSLLSSRFSGNFFEFLCYMSSSEVAPGVAIGSCTERRHSPTSQLSKLDWGTRQSLLLDLIKKHFFLSPGIEQSRNIVESACVSFVDEMARSEDFPCVGGFLATQFLQVSSLLGLCPLVCYSFAKPSDVKFGSGHFIQFALGNESMSAVEIETEFKKLYDDIESIWDDGKISMSVIENTLCELGRSYWITASTLLRERYQKKKIKLKAIKKWKPNRLPPIAILKDDAIRVESETKDVFYHFKHRNEIQHFFKLEYSGDGASKYKPCLKMVTVQPTGDKRKQSLRITNWKKDSKDKKMSSWTHRGSQMNLDSKLVMSKKLQLYFN